MFDSSSYDNPTPLAHADASRDVFPRGGGADSRIGYLRVDNNSRFYGRRRRRVELFSPTAKLSCCFLKNVQKIEKYGKFTEDCIPDGVFPIGDDVFVFASTYYDSVSVHIRRFKKYVKAYSPTPEGITLDPR
ncbi:hypothetical protein TNCV_3986751 [Trichonephila clavipes]|nr:hypothetical protein TNCV_3986751 [Trichonephila clavipes]